MHGNKTTVAVTPRAPPNSSGAVLGREATAARGAGDLDPAQRRRVADILACQVGLWSPYTIAGAHTGSNIIAYLSIVSSRAIAVSLSAWAVDQSPVDRLRAMCAQ